MSMHRSILLLAALAGSGHAANPPPWPPSYHLTGYANGTTTLFGVSITVDGPFEWWGSCDAKAPQQGKLKAGTSLVKYGTTILNTTVTIDCAASSGYPNGLMTENIAVPLLPDACIPIPVPPPNPAPFYQCASCPSYAFFPVESSCSGWSSTPGTLRTATGTQSVMIYTSTGCQNITTANTPALVEKVLFGVTMYYPIGHSTSPLKIVQSQELWTIAQGVNVHLSESSEITVSNFFAGPLGPAAFAPCNPTQ